MRTLAIYYVTPTGERQKFVILKPSSAEVEHYLWIAGYIKKTPVGSAMGLFGARMEIPIRTGKRDWLLTREGIKTIRIEEIDEQGNLLEAAA